MTKAQSAMEFMLTYGWAILVVMVVGIVMWQIGVFDNGASTTTTSEGFSQLKPMLATCKMSEEVWNPSAPPTQRYNGFQCMFTNPLNTRITIVDINVTFDGRNCQVSLIDIIPEYIDGQSSYQNRLCYDDQGDCDPRSCSERGGGACTCNGPGCSLNRPAGFTLFVNALSKEGFGGTCWDMEPGRKYEAFIDITYNISIGGIQVTKHDTGYIRGAQE